MPLLKQFKTPFGSIRITRERDGTLAYYQNGCFHSQATRRGVSICAYVHAIHEIIRQKKSRRVLIIGCAGGTLATMLSRLGCQVTVVDINPVAFTIARDYFQMPAAVTCVQKDGLGYIRTVKERFDAIVIDVFGSDNMVPRGFTTKAFFTAAQKVLRRGGNIIMNVILHDEDDRRGTTLARNMKASGMDVTIYDWPAEEDRNALVVGGSVKGVRVPSGKEPWWIRKDMKDVVQRK